MRLLQPAEIDKIVPGFCTAEATNSDILRRDFLVPVASNAAEGVELASMASTSLHVMAIFHVARRARVVPVVSQTTDRRPLHDFDGARVQAPRSSFKAAGQRFRARSLEG